MRPFMYALVLLGGVPIFVGFIGHLAPYKDSAPRAGVKFSAHTMSMFERVAFVGTGMGIIAFAMVSMKGKGR